MNENEYLAGIICEHLEQNSPIVLASILNIQGSSPRHSGSKMLIGPRGKTYGTIGGSLIEATAIKEAQNILISEQSMLMDFELSGQDANAPGMICGGKAQILLDYLAANETNRQLFQSWLEAARQGRNFFYLTQLKTTGNAMCILGHMILFPDGQVVGGNRLHSSELDSIKSELHNVSTTSVIPLAVTDMVVSRIQKVKTLYCFGAGHVAQPTAHIAALVGFRVVVIDDRAEFSNRDRFTEAAETLVIPDLKQALNGLEIDADSFIVIVTRGHQYDRAVLEQSLKTQSGYIGMISSRKKKAAIYEALLAQGVAQAELDRVHSPIGIDIGGETPEEIGVSIVAELISERTKQK
jgi:xanthine dehydrogenase accessory factor